MKYNKNSFVSDTFDKNYWKQVKDFEFFKDITYHESINKNNNNKFIVRIAFNRPNVRNSFRPETIDELYCALNNARMNPNVSSVLLTGNGPSTKDGIHSFCAGGDQKSRSKNGYKYSDNKNQHNTLARMHILEVQRLIRIMPKVVIAVVNGWAVGGGHSLHVICDISVASEEFARFKQTDAKVASFDGGYGSAFLARQVGQKKAREIFFLGKEYSAQDMYDMGAVNAVVKHKDIEKHSIEWSNLVALQSPQSIRMLKLAFNLVDDGLMGQQIFSGEATRLAYMTEEAKEGKNAFLEKRAPNWSEFPYYF